MGETEPNLGVEISGQIRSALSKPAAADGARPVAFHPRSKAESAAGGRASKPVTPCRRGRGRENGAGRTPRGMFKTMAIEQSTGRPDLGRALIDTFGKGWSRGNVDLLMSVYRPSRVYRDSLLQPLRGTRRSGILG